MARPVSYTHLSQRSSLIAVDENGGALRDAIMWQDKRSEPLCAAVDERYDPYAVCGMRPTPVYTGPKILWLRQNEPDVFMSAYKFLGVHEYLLHRMTGRFVTDESVASRSCMLDLYTRRWSPRPVSYTHLLRCAVGGCGGPIQPAFQFLAAKRRLYRADVVSGGLCALPLSLIHIFSFVMRSASNTWSYRSRKAVAKIRLRTSSRFLASRTS